MLKKLIGPLLIVVAIVIVILMVINKPRPEIKNAEAKQSINLLVKNISPEQHPMFIPAEGFVNSRWQTTLSSQVSGQVVEISDQLLVGNQFSQGEVLLKINPLDFQVQLARAQANLSSAESNLVEQEMQSERAKSDWNKLNPDRKPSDFNLRLPQLKTAQNNLLAAKQELKLAQENLNRTQIKAPFDGFSVSRNIDLGEQLQVGGVVAEIVDRKNLELKVSLTTQQAALVEQAISTKIKLIQSAAYETDNDDIELNVKAMRFEPFIDSENRWRSLVLELGDGSYQPLIGDFLSLSIVVDEVSDMLSVPESALSIDGRIWYVDKSDKAQFFKPEIIYKNSGQLYLSINNSLSYPLNLVVSPPNSLLSGVAVETNSNSTAVENELSL